MIPQLVPPARTNDKEPQANLVCTVTQFLKLCNYRREWQGASRRFLLNEPAASALRLTSQCETLSRRGLLCGVP